MFFFKPIGHLYNERWKAEVKSDSTLFWLRVFVETRCRSYGTQSFAQTCFATVNMPQHSNIYV